MTFAERLHELREKAGLSQSELAKASGVPVWTVRGYEQGRREPLWNVLFKLAKALGVTCEAFADCDGVAKTAPPPPKAKKSQKRTKG
jgi:transcriptional regulator with XRE-family HTH domain